MAAATTAAAALIAINKVIAVALPILSAAGVNTAALTAVMSTATAAASSLGPFAPAALAALYLAKAGSTIRKSRKAAEACEDRAGAYLVELGRTAPRFTDVPTSQWPECWHRGLKTKNRRDGRVSERIPLTVIRYDVLPTGQGDGPDLAYAALGRPLGDDELLAAAWLGPWGLGRGGMRPLDIIGWSPSGTMACTLTMRTMMANGVDSETRARLVEVMRWAAKVASGRPVRMTDGTTRVASPYHQGQCAELVAMASTAILA